MPTYTAFAFGDPAEESAYINPTGGHTSSLIGISGGWALTLLPSWGGFTFSNGVLGVAYSQIFDLSPAASPTTFALGSGSLPTGLSLSNLTGDQGEITGTPTATGTFTFTLSATNTYGSTNKTFSIVVVAAAGGGSFTFAC
jgi:hypothetical protein